MVSENSGKKPLLLVDAYSQIYRGFYAVRSLSNSKGLPSNAVFAMAKLLLRLEKEYPAFDGAFVFDKGKIEKRLAVAPDYKANRPPMPEELKIQIPYIRDLIRAFGWNIIEYEGYEADDLMGAMAKSFDGRKVLILSSDKDISQVIDKEDRVNMLVPSHDGKGLNIRSYEETIRKFGVPPEKIVDYLSLIGDSSDNIPGVPGIGPKTAASLLNESGSISEIFCDPQRIRKDSLREKILAHKEVLKKNIFLTTLFTELPEEANITESSVRKNSLQEEKVCSIIEEFELKSIAKEVENLSPVSSGENTSAEDLFCMTQEKNADKKETAEQLFFDF
ncbi:MAG: 5'-3' exonuclease [Lentisphaeria bacterium]|nr:5'-3' exonuclease [Lentisphaeria bacterium]